jgi:hypothetical protein
MPINEIPVPPKMSEVVVVFLKEARFFCIQLELFKLIPVLKYVCVRGGGKYLDQNIKLQHKCSIKNTI